MTKQFDYIIKKYNLNPNSQYVEIPNMGRDDLASLFKELDFTKGAEVGVERGLYAKVLLENNPGLFLYAVDAWLPYSGYRDHVTQEKMDSLFTEAQANLNPFIQDNRCVIIRDFSAPAAKEFKDNSLDFVYIDANHELKHVIEDIYEWTKKVKVGGIVAGHDYIQRKYNGYLMHVVEAVDAYAKAYSVKPIFLVGTKEVKEGEKRDRPRSWFFVKTEEVVVKQGYGQL